MFSLWIEDYIHVAFISLLSGMSKPKISLFIFPLKTVANPPFALMGLNIVIFSGPSAGKLSSTNLINYFNNEGSVETLLAGKPGISL